MGIADMIRQETLTRGRLLPAKLNPTDSEISDLTLSISLP
jgi:hypothetical protein